MLLDPNYMLSRLVIGLTNVHDKFREGLVIIRRKYATLKLKKNGKALEDSFTNGLEIGWMKETKYSSMTEYSIFLKRRLIPMSPTKTWDTVFGT